MSEADYSSQFPEFFKEMDDAAGHILRAAKLCNEKGYHVLARVVKSIAETIVGLSFVYTSIEMREE